MIKSTIFLVMLAVAVSSARSTPIGLMLDENFASYQIGGLGGQTATNGNIWTARSGAYAAGGPVVNQWRGINKSVGGIGASDVLYGADLPLAAATDGTLVMKADLYQLYSNQPTRFVRLHYQDLSGGEISIRRNGTRLEVGSTIGIAGGSFKVGSTLTGQETGWVHTELHLKMDGSGASLLWDIGSSNGTIDLGAYANPFGVFHLDNLFMYYKQSNSSLFMADNIYIENIPNENNTLSIPEPVAGGLFLIGTVTFLRRRKIAASMMMLIACMTGQVLAVDGAYSTNPVIYYNPNTGITTNYFPVTWYGSYGIWSEDNFGWLNRVTGNTIAATVDPDDASYNALGNLLNAANARNKKVVVTFANEFVDGVKTPQLTRFVNLAKAHEATLGYILGDEMNSHPETSAAEAVSSASIIAGLDPNRQIWQVFGGRVDGSATPYLAGARVISNDYYTYAGLPVGNPLPPFKDAVLTYEHNARSGLYAANNNRSYVHFTQAFGFDAAMPNHFQLPSELEYRHNVFQAIAGAGSRGIVDYIYAPPAYGDPFGVFFPWEANVLNPVNAELMPMVHAMETGYRVGTVGLSWTHTAEDAAHGSALAWNLMSQLLVHDDLTDEYFLIVTNNGFDPRNATITLANLPSSLNTLSAYVDRSGETLRLQDLGGGSYQLNDTLAGHEVMIYKLNTDIFALGDFNNDGNFNAADIDLLCEELHHGGANDLLYDVNGDDHVNLFDLAYEVETIIGTHFGDSDLDSDVDLADLATLASNYGQSPRAWARGDFDCDEDVDLADLSVLARYYGQGEAQAFADFQSFVPEPATVGLLAISYLLLQRHPGRHANGVKKAA